MSAICGVVYPEKLFDQTLMVEQRNLLLKTLSHRGVDGSGCWHNDRAAFGHQMMYITPESIDEVQPAIVNAGSLVCISDSRIDNRESIIETLAIKDYSIPDSLLILAAYKYWGTECSKHFIGDFTFAIWDEEKQRLFCSRDHFGLRQFFYTLHKNVLYFSTELKSLLELSIEKTVNLERVKLFCNKGFPKNNSDETFFKEIKQLKPAHNLIYHKSVLIKQYWQINAEEKDENISENDYIEACREVLLKAIKCRTRTPFQIGSELSGGIDSSIVSAMARRESNQKVFHSVHYCPSTENNELGFAKSLAKKANIELSVYSSALPLYEIKERLKKHGEPWNMSGNIHHYRAGECLRNNNVRVCLNGQFGDLYGAFDYILFDYLEKHNWDGVQSRLSENFVGNELKRTFTYYVDAEMKCVANEDGFGRFFRASMGLRKYSNFSISRALYRYWFRYKRNSSLGTNFFIKFKKCNEKNIEKNEDIFCSHLSQTPIAQVYQFLDCVYSSSGVQAVSPLGDLRVVKFFNKVPLKLLHTGKSNRSLLKNSIKDYLPPDILEREDKFYFDKTSQEEFLQEPESSFEVCRNFKIYPKGIKIQNIDKWQYYCNSKPELYEDLWRLAMLSHWRV